MLGYGESKDQGRNPGNYVDSDRLEEWIRIKPVFPRDEKGRFLPRTPKIMRSLAFLINRSIHDHGVIGSHFFSEAFDFYYKRLDKDVKEAAVKDLDLIFKGRE